MLQDEAPKWHTDVFQIPKGSIYITTAFTRSLEPEQIMLTINEPIGRGTFGLVYKAHVNKLDSVVAIKQVANNSNHSGNELKIMNNMLDHCNIVRLMMHCFTGVCEPRQRYMLLIMEYMPMSLLKYISQYDEHQIPFIYVRVLSYQMFRGLAHLHSQCICHRDVKPDNMLLDPTTMNLKLSDFGSAKLMKKNELSSTYICSRLYRAPELFAKIETYDTSMDIWSAGCVLAELIKGTPLFRNEYDQLLHMMTMLGTVGLVNCPELLAKVSWAENLPIIARPSSQTLIGKTIPHDLAALLNQCLVFNPTARIAPLKACAHPSYDELRLMDTLRTPMPSGAQLPPLFNFSKHELQVDPDLWMHLLPLQLSEL
ncbi:glycogen synthase kinase-3 alpha [Drosophila grimshawi]|uniref:GH11389 n=1 Tax=Drosophila grimshawi TaxID=7222 RepID=B4JA48_DROGR|nr:glycogen synthase kinase-3 alpha [Drosophila grimshawi]EDW03722.1 GH11389 [Drosophila grimshawi]